MDLAATFEAQRSAFRRRTPDYPQRMAALSSLEKILIKNQGAIAQAISADFGGRATEETIALELVPTLGEIRYAIAHLRGWMQSRRVSVSWQFQPGRAKVMYQPLGVVGILAAWNYPLFLSFAPLAGAIAAGNHVMLKPSELAPHSAELMQSMIAEIFPSEYVTVILGDAETGAAFSRLPFDHVLYTGSARIGRLVMKVAAENLTPVTLELGGKSPAIVHRDYPLRKAAERIMTGKLYNAGQTCVAPDYALIPRDRVPDFVNLAGEITRHMYPRLAANPDYTRIINARHYERLRSLSDGLKMVEINPAGEICDVSNRVFPPMLVVDPPLDSAVMQEEIFGPILPIIGYDSLEEAIEFVNSRPHPLALYYFDENRSRINRVLESTSAGGVTVNDCMFHVAQCELPFGGVGPSGMGRYHGFDGFETFSKKKGVFLQGRWTALSLLRPPYGEAARRLLRFIVE